MMLDFIFNKKYLSVGDLSNYQDSILLRQGMNLTEIDSFISELEKYNIIFNRVFNSLTENKIYIRQNLILAVLYNIKKDSDACREKKMNADGAFLNMKMELFYLEGYSSFQKIVSAYEFYFRFVSPPGYGVVNLKHLYTMRDFYSNISGPDGSILTTDTYLTDKILNQDRIGFSNESYSAYYMNNQTTFVFINHNNRINKLAKNLNVNYEFGHFAIFNKNKWLVIHPFYPGFREKMNSKIRESWNNNIILDGIKTKEPYWRYWPKKHELNHTKKANVHYFTIGKDITRKIEILSNGIFVTDNGGDFSSFNLCDDAEFHYSGKAVEKIGYHSDEKGKITIHKRLELRGESRIFWMAF